MTDRLTAFLTALEQVDPDTLVSPPGLGGLWRARHIKSGLGRRVLVEYDGIIAFSRNPHHGACQGCSGRKRDICTHCNCSTCIWERETDEHGGKPVTRAQVDALL